MRLLCLLAVVLAWAAAGCQALDADPILGKTPFQPGAGTPAPVGK